MSGDTSTPQYAFMAWCSVENSTRTTWLLLTYDYFYRGSCQNFRAVLSRTRPVLHRFNFMLEFCNGWNIGQNNIRDVPGCCSSSDKYLVQPIMRHFTKFQILKLDLLLLTADRSSRYLQNHVTGLLVMFTVTSGNRSRLRAQRPADP
jgi:hypothetical protein